jgi:hypothetical protein
MKMLSYIQYRAAALEELVLDPMTVTVYTPGWDITVTARMPQKGITMKMKAGVILKQQLAVQVDSFLGTMDESLNLLTGV